MSCNVNSTFIKSTEQPEDRLLLALLIQVNIDYVGQKRIWRNIQSAHNVNRLIYISETDSAGSRKSQSIELQSVRRARAPAN